MFILTGHRHKKKIQTFRTWHLNCFFNSIWLNIDDDQTKYVTFIIEEKRFCFYLSAIWLNNGRIVFVCFFLLFNLFALIFAVCVTFFFENEKHQFSFSFQRFVYLLFSVYKCCCYSVEKCSLSRVACIFSFFNYFHAICADKYIFYTNARIHTYPRTLAHLLQVRYIFSFLFHFVNTNWKFHFQSGCQILLTLTKMLHEKCFACWLFLTMAR